MKYLVKAVTVILIAVLVAIYCSGCHEATRDLGGSMTLELEPGRKLEEITWKESSLWYLTRPMREGEHAETHIFQQDSEWGVFEGTVTIIEKEAIGDEKQ